MLNGVGSRRQFSYAAILSDVPAGGQLQIQYGQKFYKDEPELETRGVSNPKIGLKLPPALPLPSRLLSGHKIFASVRGATCPSSLTSTPFTFGNGYPLVCQAHQLLSWEKSAYSITTAER